MRFLVAGGAGFLGTNLSSRLLHNGHEIVVVDNFCTGSLKNLTPLKSKFSNQLTIHHLDIVAPLPKFKGKFNVIINMACPASPQAYQRMPLETLRVSSIGTENLLKLALKDEARFVHASTSEVYGEPEIHPQIENYWGRVNPYGARSMYDEGKRYAEALIWSYRKLLSVNSGIIRIFNTYGPFMSAEDGRVITNFLYQALEGKELTIYGDGRQTRSFCYVDDQIEGWMRMIWSDLEGPINIGNPEEFSMTDLIKTIEKVLGKKLQVTFCPRPEDDPTQRCPDITKAKKFLDWEPKISLEKGIRKMVDWINSNHKIDHNSKG